MKNPTNCIIGAILVLLTCKIVSAQDGAGQSQPSVTSLPTAAPSDTTVSPPKFGEMNVQDRNVILGEIAKQDFPAILQAFVDAGRLEHDSGKQDMLWRILASAMRQRTPPPQFFTQMKAFIEDSSNSNLERGRMISALRDAATKESADLLIFEATTLKDKQLRDKAIGDIGALGESQDVNIAPALEKLWRESNDQQMLMSTSLAMAKIGAPSSINLLFSDALTSNGLDNARKTVAKGALTTVISKRAVPALAAALDKQSPTSPQAILAFTTLTQIVDVSDQTSIHVLMTWLQTTDDSAAPLAYDWIAHSKWGPELKAAQAALDPAVRFNNEANRQALQQGLEAYKQTHHFNPLPPTNPQ